MSEVFAITIFKCAESIVGRPLTEGKASFTHTKPSYIECYSHYLAGESEFSASHLKVSIPLHLCEIPNVSADHENYLLAKRQCEFMQEQLSYNKNTVKYQVESIMLAYPSEVLTEDEVAAGLCISKRTLARRLQKEGTGFRQIRDEIVSKQAIDYLRNSSLSTDAVAALLNYHDSANFRRAFKRWFQITPDQYRQQNINESTEIQ